jgi:hypothetical protein
MTAPAGRAPRNTRTKRSEGEAQRTDTRYTPELAADILRCVSEGTPLRQVCRDKGIAESTVRTWFRDDRDGLAARYEVARRMQVDAWAEEIVLLANREDLDANEKRVRIDTLKWLCSKLVPRRYGDRLLVAGEAESPLQILHKQVSLNELTDDQLDALERFTTTVLRDQRK